MKLRTLAVELWSQYCREPAVHPVAKLQQVEWEQRQYLGTETFIYIIYISNLSSWIYCCLKWYLKHFITLSVMPQKLIQQLE